MLGALIVFAIFILGQFVIHIQVRTYFLDDHFYELILSELRSRPTAYYSISDALFHELIGPTPFGLGYHFPLIFYIWLLVPSIGDIKWLYLVFALAGVVASYFAILAATKNSLVAFFSAAWMAYFLETGYFLMLDYWPVPVFLIGLALFLTKHHGWAAAAIGVTTLIKEVFAPFMVMASVYYLLAARREWIPYLHDLMIRHREGRNKFLSGAGKTRQAVAWISATIVVGSMYILNDIASYGFPPSAHAMVQQILGFEPGVLWLLFTEGYFRNPPLIPIVVAVALALIGIAFLDRDQKIIMLLSFVLLPLLIPTGVISTVPGATLANLGAIWVHLTSRWIAMSLVMVNLFWLTGAYNICKYIYFRLHILRLSLSRQSVNQVKATMESQRERRL